MPSVIPNPLYAEITGPAINLVVNGKLLTALPTPPIIQQGRTLVPAGAVFESLGATVSWNGYTQTVYIQNSETLITLVIDRPIINVNGYAMAMDVPARIINDNTMIPLRAVSENLGFEVDLRNNTVYIDKPVIITPEPPSDTNPHFIPARDVSDADIVTVPFPKTNIISVSVPSEFAEQTFTITASAPITTVRRFQLYDNRLAIDFVNAQTNLNGSFYAPAYSSITGIRVSQFTEDTARVAFDLPNGAVYSIGISYDRMQVILTIYSYTDSRNHYIPVNYNYAPNIAHNPTIGTFRIPKANGFTMDIGQIIHDNRYHSNQYILTLPIDASQHIASGTMAMSDALLYSVTVGQNQYGNTRLILTGTQILSVYIFEDNNYYHIRVICPRDRYPRIVVIDPGHGGRPGAVYNDVRAADLNVAVSRKLLQLIEAGGYMRAFTTRNTDISIPLTERARLGSEIGDLMVTIHHNAAHNTDIHGVETFYHPNDFDEFRPLTSQNFASIMQRNLLTETGRHDRDYRTADFVVLRYATVPAVLIEVGFMSNPHEFSTLISEEYQWRAARAIYNSLLEAFAIYTPVR